jgi:putative transcriptional regulator
MRYALENTDDVILAELGQRLTAARLARNLKQDELAERAGLSKRTLERMETGHSVQLSNFIRALRGLGLLENLEQFIPEALPSPLAQLKLRKKQRHRASTPRGATRAPGNWTWNDDKK